MGSCMQSVCKKFARVILSKGTTNTVLSQVYTVLCSYIGGQCIFFNYLYLFIIDIVIFFRMSILLPNHVFTELSQAHCILSSTLFIS